MRTTQNINVVTISGPKAVLYHDTETREVISKVILETDKQQVTLAEFGAKDAIEFDTEAEMLQYIAANNLIDNDGTINPSPLHGIEWHEPERPIRMYISTESLGKVATDSQAHQLISLVHVQGIPFRPVASGYVAYFEWIEAPHRQILESVGGQFEWKQ